VLFANRLSYSCALRRLFHEYPRPSPKPAFASSSRLLEEEARHWHDELHWDYRGALDLIKRFPSKRTPLCGCVAFENGSAAGYSLSTCSKKQKGTHRRPLCFRPRFFPKADIGRPPASKKCSSPCAPLPQAFSRIEAQLMPFGGPVDNPLRDQGLSGSIRAKFMLLDLHKNNSEHRRAGASLEHARGNRLERSLPSEPCAKN